MNFCMMFANVGDYAVPEAAIEFAQMCEDSDQTYLDRFRLPDQGRSLQNSLSAQVRAARKYKP
jgi:hypothetical protein